MHAQIKSVCIVLILALAIAVINCKLSSWNSQDAWLYPGRSQRGIHLTFSNLPDWSDLWEVMSENGFFTFGLLCIRGVFALYQEPLYAVSKPHEVEIVSGSMRCTMISENTKSIQLIGSVGRMYGPSITFFEKPYFGSPGFSTVVNVGSDFMNKMESIRSAIIVGQVPWTLTFSSGESICVQPEFDTSEGKPICLIRDFKALMDTSTDGYGTDLDNELLDNATTVFTKATQGCKDVTDDQSIYRIQDCLYWGRPSKPDEVAIEFKDVQGGGLGGRSDANVSQGDLLCSGGDSAKRIFTLYKAVVTKDFDTDILVGLDNVGTHSWKLDLLDWIYTIVTDVVPNDLIPTSFLNKVRELFVHKLITVWNKNEINEPTLLEKNYKTLLLLTEQCEADITLSTSHQEDGGASVAELLSEEFSNMWDNIQSMADFEDQINPEFKRRPEFDVIAEITWIAGHMAGWLCHEQYMTISHFWALYFNIFWNFYIEPAVSDWTTPTEGLSLFFGGVDYELEYNKLAMFAGVAKKRARNMPPLVRVQEFLANETDIDDPNAR